MSMIEPPLTATLCRACGEPLPQSTPSGGFCPHCGAPQAEGETPADVQLYPPPADQFPLTPVAQPAALDPDHPRWGVWTGIGTWLFSVAALIVAGVALLIPLMLIERPQPGDTAWATSPHVMVATVYSTLLAHVMTILFC